MGDNLQFVELPTGLEFSFIKSGFGMTGLFSITSSEVYLWGSWSGGNLVRYSNTPFFLFDLYIIFDF